MSLLKIEQLAKQRNIFCYIIHTPSPGLGHADLGGEFWSTGHFQPDVLLMPPTIHTGTGRNRTQLAAVRV